MLGKKKSPIKAANLPTIEALTSVQVWSSLVQEMDRPEGTYTAALYQYERFCSSKTAVCLTVIVAENVFNVDLFLQSSLHRPSGAHSSEVLLKSQLRAQVHRLISLPPCFPGPEEGISSQKKPMD